MKSVEEKVNIVTELDALYPSDEKSVGFEIMEAIEDEVVEQVREKFNELLESEFNMRHSQLLAFAGLSDIQFSLTQYLVGYVGDLLDAFPDPEEEQEKLAEQNKQCWCGRLRSEHLLGHKDD